METTIMENQMEKKMENEMETGIIMGYTRSRLLISLKAAGHNTTHVCVSPSKFLHKASFLC